MSVRAAVWSLLGIIYAPYFAVLRQRLPATIPGGVGRCIRVGGCVCRAGDRRDAGVVRFRLGRFGLTEIALAKTSPPAPHENGF